MRAVTTFEHITVLFAVVIGLAGVIAATLVWVLIGFDWWNLSPATQGPAT